MKQAVNQIPASLTDVIDEVDRYFSENTKVKKLFKNCFLNTYQTTLKEKEDGTTFVITGDIPAMWLRDSASQVRPYLMVAAEDEQIARMIKGVIRKQFQYMLIDPYANAFNEEPNGNGHQDDVTDMSPIVWERKYEIDSLCYPVQLAYLYWKETKDDAIFDDMFFSVIETILEVWKIEQRHDEQSDYHFIRRKAAHTDTLPNEGKGAETAWTGMTWSGFRPSDDSCLYGYLIPANMFAVVVLEYAQEICEIHGKQRLSEACEDLAGQIRNGIETYGTVDHPLYGRVYVYETDGKGQYVIMDDANVPSLLAAPYLGYCSYTDETYQNTRKLILSRENPFFYEGKAAEGIGSPHTPDHFIWHISLSIQGLTSISAQERQKILHYLISTDGGENFMHEGFHADDPTEFTRSWFAWSNSMFSEFVLSMIGKAIHHTPLDHRLKNSIK